MSFDNFPKTRGPFEIESHIEVYRNRWITVHEYKVRRPGGSPGLFGIIEMVAGSSVLPVDADGYVYLSEEFKYAVNRTTIEVFSGALEEEETSLHAAQRELLEELGYVAAEWIDLGTIDPFTTVVSSTNHMFLAKDLSKSVANPDEGEVIKTIRLPFTEALRMVLDGKITHGASCALILKAARVMGV